MKKVGIVVLICILVCTSCQSVSTWQEDVNKSYKIGLSFDSFVIERWHREQDAFVSRAEELGAKVYVQNANGDVEKQIEQLNYFIEQKVDVIVVIATDGLAVSNVIKKAKSENIKVIAYDRLVEDANVDIYISFDNKKIGELMTEMLVSRVPVGGKILALFGSPTDHNVKIIVEAFDEIVKKNRVKVIDRIYAENWLSETAFWATSEYLKGGEMVDGVFCGNDDLAGSAIRALAEKRLAGKVCVVGQDADLAACQRVVEGTQAMTIFKDVIELAKKAAEVAVDLAEGKELEVTDTINDGSYEVPYYALEPIRVTKDNMDEVIIDGGFHLREDVYLNMIEMP